MGDNCNPIYEKKRLQLLSELDEELIPCDLFNLWDTFWAVWSPDLNGFNTELHGYLKNVDTKYNVTGINILNSMNRAALRAYMDVVNG